MEIDFKVTMWERITVDDKHANIIRKKLESGEITNDDDIYNLDIEELYLDLDTLYDTAEQLTVKDNGGSPTIEMRIRDKVIWTNTSNLIHKNKV